MKDKDKAKETKKNILPEGVTLEQLQANWTEADSAYAPLFRRMRIIDATDRGKLWKAINAKFPNYQVLPDTNHVTYIKSNLLSSLYSIGRSAHLSPTSENDVETVKHTNITLDHIWDTQLVSFYQMQAGERAALLNIGLTQVGWDNSMLRGTEETFSKGNISLKNIDPMKFMRDPYAEDLATSAYCMTWDVFHKNVILRNNKYSAGFKEFLATETTGGAVTADTVSKMTDQQNKPSKDYYKIVTHWVLHDGKIHEIHTVDSKHVIFVKENIKPSMFPFAELFCNLPSGDVIGTSEPSKIFANTVAYNLMNSIILTAEVKNQKPPRFVNVNSQINLRDFIKHGADSDYTFAVQGDATKAVHYHQFPQVSPIVQSIMASLNLDIQQVTGVDGKYTGKDTGSILTTGGIEQMLDQATLIDQPKIVNYERYTVQLTRLILGNLREHGHERSYFVKNPKTRQHETITINFDAIKDDTVFDYVVNISAHLPKNKQRIQQMANVIMEKQMQYNQEGQQGVSLITPEEWLMMQDLPYMELMLERMGLERSKDYVDKVAKVVYQYANLLDQGLSPEDALMATADAMQTGQPSPMMSMPAPNEANAMPPIPPTDTLPPMDF